MYIKKILIKSKSYSAYFIQKVYARVKKQIKFKNFAKSTEK